MGEMVEYLQKNRDFAVTFIKDELPFVDVIKPEATYLLWIDFRKLGLKPSELEKFLIAKAKIGLNNGLIYGKEGSGFARLNFGTQRDMLKMALENLKQAINDFIV
jgi:cystathionine beta-lyase